MVRDMSIYIWVGCLESGVLEFKTSRKGKSIIP